MASSILSALLSKPIVRFVNEENGLPVWTDAKTVDVERQSDSDNSDVPMSSQQVSGTAVTTELLASDISTGKILRPNHMRVHILTDNLSLIENIFSLFEDTTVTLSITSKSIISTNMAIMSVEVDQSSEVLSAVRVSINFERSRVSKVVPFDPSQSSDQNSFGLSLQSPPTVSSNLGTIQNQIGSIVNTTGSAVTSLYNKFATSIGL